MNDIRLNDKMGLPNDGSLPSAEQVRKAELMFACTREDSVKAYYEKMKAGEDLYMKSALAELAEDIASQAFKGKVDVEFKRSYASEHPRSTSSVRRNEIYMDTIIKYSDGTYHMFDDYLDIMTYLHAMCEFLIDYLTSDEMEYSVETGRRIGGRPMRPGQQPDPEPTREEKIRQAFSGASSREDGFNLLVSWGDEDFESAVEQMETMAQYDSYVTGVPLSDILA